MTAPPALGRIVAIDAEANGLAGQAFAVAMSLSEHGRELATAVHRCPIEGEVNAWVADNVLPVIEDIPVTSTSYAGMLASMRVTYAEWLATKATVAAHVVWPVEARLLLDLFPGADIWLGPYPLIDVAAALRVRGYDPLDPAGYLTGLGVRLPEGSPHHPLYDARVAALTLHHLLKEPSED